MDDKNSQWRRADERYDDGKKIDPTRERGGLLTSLRFWIVVAVTCLVLVVILASIIISLVVGRSQVAVTNVINHNQSPSPVGNTPISTPVQPTVAPTLTPTSALPCIVNVSTWTGGSADWKVLNNVLLNDGTNNTGNSQPTIVAPCQLGGATDYAVEAKIQVSSFNGWFGITVRGTPTSNGSTGYTAGVANYFSDTARVDYINGSISDTIAQAPFTPGSDLHTYRVEVKGNTIRFLIDGSPLVEVTDNKYLTGQQVGLWDNNVQLQVSSFQVMAL